jgi:hypothetical protein
LQGSIVHPGSVRASATVQTKKGDGMKRLHLHVAIASLPEAIAFYSGLFDATPCCSGTNYANWRIDQPPLNLAASVGNRPSGIAHLGLEVGSPAELAKVDRVLRSASPVFAAVPWEVSVRTQSI